MGQNRCFQTDSTLGWANICWVLSMLSEHTHRRSFQSAPSLRREATIRGKLCDSKKNTLKRYCVCSIQWHKFFYVSVRTKQSIGSVMFIECHQSLIILEFPSYPMHKGYVCPKRLVVQSMKNREHSSVFTRSKTSELVIQCHIEGTNRGSFFSWNLIQALSPFRFHWDWITRNMVPIWLWLVQIAVFYKTRGSGIA